MNIPRFRRNRIAVVALVVTIASAGLAQTPTPAPTPPPTPTPPSPTPPPGQPNPPVINNPLVPWSRPLGGAGSPGDFSSLLPNSPLLNPILAESPGRHLLFAPTPPPLGDLAPPSPRGLPVAPRLAAFGQEYFAPQLSALYLYDGVPPPWRERLARYQQLRDAAVDQLRTQIDQVRALPSAERRSFLAQHATGAAPALARLEQEAEHLRDLLTNGDWNHVGIHWTTTHRYQQVARTGPTMYTEGLLDVAMYLHDDLSPDQRALLRVRRAQLADPESGNLLYLPPFPASVRLPAELPTELAAGIDAYQRLLQRLQEELHEDFRAAQRPVLASTRAQRVRALAERQAADFSELHRQADEIRVQLAASPAFQQRTSETQLDPQLARRVQAYEDHKAAVQRQVTTQLQRWRQTYPQLRLEFISGPQGHGHIGAVGNPPPRLPNPPRQEIEAYNRELHAQLTKLNAERVAISEVVRHVLAQAAPSRQSRQASMETYLAEFTEIVRSQQQQLKYQDYHDALFQPGLSPPQRRLLFGAAVRQLNLPFELEPR
jgi:hypothetical protein